ncbi:replicative DNA helicase (plasmid) [Streptomyces albidoflavus]|uniref:replicative DNA helicase n=1 Tax=Streptomyces albidoflavus TaxID=1886 RepID=UPI00226D56C1|nr:replicative DNA helicase [Streptomyces albidoflavus]WSU19607.1 replicative DNA helicase [Streptomyces albidoflavus]WTC33767.1 replicative DNA helicase [Streptomyces albidoflavus]CAI4198578.1 replicative DNA helicase [Streptomyces albidoflavus]
MTIVAPSHPADDPGFVPQQDRGPDRTPPQDLAAEAVTLGAQMLSKDSIDGVINGPLQLRDYYRPAHETIQAAILHLYGQQEPVDPITVAAELTKRGELQKVGGAPYLHTLVQMVPTESDGPYYAEIVHEKAVLRRLVQAGQRITHLASSGEGELDDVRDSVEAEVQDALQGRAETAGYALVREDVPQFWDDLDARMKGGTDQMTGLPTGFADLDSLTNGLQPGQMVVIAARPAMGKSTLALDIARSAAIKHGLPTAFFSLEMSRQEITMRLYSAEARVALHHIRSGLVSEGDLDRLAGRTSDIEAAPLIVDESPNLSMMEIRSRARQMARSKTGLKLLVVDYLQLMKAGGTGRQENRQQEVSEMSRNIKLLAKELEIPVIALSQLNRGPEQRTDKKPMVSDLRESGSIEQDADMVILLHREDAYEKESPRAGEADLIVAKHRNGPTATITVAFQGHYSRFVDMAQS